MVHRIALVPVLLLAAAGVAADAVSMAALPGPEAMKTTGSWQPLKEVNGVPVEARSTDTGFDAHRGRVEVCTDLDSLEDFVVDPSRFSEWVAFTRSARLLEQTEDAAVYYVRSTTPWPLKDRDMVYRISKASDDAPGVRLALTGLPDYAPVVDSAARIRSASGEWRLVPGDAGIDVSYELFVDPGSVPRFLANQRLATAVGQTLANLAARFPCKHS